MLFGWGKTPSGSQVSCFWTLLAAWKGLDIQHASLGLRGVQLVRRKNGLSTFRSGGTIYGEFSKGAPPSSALHFQFCVEDWLLGPLSVRKGDFWQPCSILSGANCRPAGCLPSLASRGLGFFRARHMRHSASIPAWPL